MVKYIIFCFLILISSSCTKVVREDCHLNESILTYEKWINEFIDIDSVVINGNMFKDDNYQKFIAENSVYDNLKCISMPKEFDAYHDELCYNSVIKISRKQNTFKYLEVNIESTSNSVNFGGFVVDSLTRYSDFFENFPHTTKLVNRDGGYTWAGIVRVKTKDNFIYFDFYLGRGRIKKVVVQYW